MIGLVCCVKEKGWEWWSEPSSTCTEVEKILIKVEKRRRKTKEKRKENIPSDEEPSQC